MGFSRPLKLLYLSAFIGELAYAEISPSSMETQRIGRTTQIEPPSAIPSETSTHIHSQQSSGIFTGGPSDIPTQLLTHSYTESPSDIPSEEPSQPYPVKPPDDTEISFVVPSPTGSPEGGHGFVPAGIWTSPVYSYIFQFPLPIPSTKTPKYTYQPNDTSASLIDYYEVELKTMEKHIYPDLPPTVLTAYDGESPGPIFLMRQGREAVIRFTNNGPYNMSVHVHGQYNRAPFDGWAADYATPGQYKDYYYPNAQNARTAWYHDHTEFTTGEHAYKGQEGMYILTDPHEQGLGLPSGKYDIILAVTSKYYNKDASLRYDTNNSGALWGDIIHVNGQPWPYLEVEPRKYRFRFLNGAISRVFNFYIAEDVNSTNKALRFDVIGSDSGLLSHPVNTEDLLMAMGERYEIIVDFANHAGQNLTLKNQRGVGGGPDYAATDLIMRFVVGDKVTDSSGDGPVPSSLRDIKPPPARTATDKNFVFERDGDAWVINGVGFRDIQHRILARPVRGEDEIWEMANGRGGATHPIHIHLVDFKILSRTGGRGEVLPYEGAGMKDVVWLSAGERIRVLARYAPWNGVYLFHCHNLVHEDNDMMVAFNVTNLKKWGYNESTQFIDPMQPEFRPKDANPEDYTEDAIMKKIRWFYDTNAYNHGKIWEVYNALDNAV